MSSQINPQKTFERVLEAAPDHLYEDFQEFKDVDDRYVVFEYDLSDGIGVVPADEVEQILEEGREENESFPLFRGIEASEAYIRNAVEQGEGLMTARINNGDVYSTGYLLKDKELEGLMTFLPD